MNAGADDPRLTAFLGAESDREAEAALAAIFDEATERLLSESVRRALAGSARGAADAADVASDTRVRLIRRLWTLRREGGAPIEDFAAYVSTTATRTCYAHLRERFPARTRVRNQVRYSVSKHPGTLLESAGGVWQCRSRALRLATSHGDVARSGQAQRFMEAPAAFLERERIDPATPLPHLIAAVLSRLDAPIELDRLVNALALVLGIADAKPVPSGAHGDPHALERVPDPSPDTVRALADRQALEALWREVIDLPANQRIALLLNLRDPDGGAALHALPVTGLVTIAGLAGVLEMSEDDLAALWDRLPLDDLTIATRLGLTRQQVINLRKSARARLARRTERI
jgi:DNA-directed RNA polymerase specialized sigma24 family protein